MVEMTSIQYSSLGVNSKELRLLAISPSENFGDDVKCLLHHADLDATVPPSYETISYVWGNPPYTDTLSVDDNVVSVPASSVAALRRMRLHSEKRIVWLDAICINQQNMAERSHQVSMMGDIYRFGSGNLIYLGEENISSALISVDAILEEAENTPGSFSLMRSEAGAWQYADSNIAADFDPKGLSELYRLSWFRRLWTLQEAALAKRNLCYCGSAVVELVRLTRVAAWLIYKYYFVDEELRLQCSYAADMNDLVDKVHGYHGKKDGHPTSVLYLLDLAQQRLSSVAVDKVYGILGLTAATEGGIGICIEPDYGNSTAEVYRQAAWSVIESRGDLEILDYVRHWTRDGEIDLDGFESWVPKWHRSKDLEEHANFMSLSFDACLSRKAAIQVQFETVSSPKTLTVSGIHVGTIAQTGERIKCDKATRTGYLKEVLGEVEAKLKTSCPENRDDYDQNIELSLAITMCAGVDSSYRPANQDIVQSYRALRGSSREGFLSPSSSESDNSQRESVTTLAGQYGEAMYNACMNRKFFTTSQGHSGLGPHLLREGDDIVVLYGLRWPAVLRRKAGKGEEMQFSFLGTAYCHGIMHGEEVEKQDSKNGSTPDVFHIR